MASKFQRRHYEEMASLIADAVSYAPRADSVSEDYLDGYEDAVHFIFTKLNIIFQNDNPYYSPSKFKDACWPAGKKVPA